MPSVGSSVSTLSLGPYTLPEGRVKTQDRARRGWSGGGKKQQIHPSHQLFKASRVSKVLGTIDHVYEGVGKLGDDPCIFYKVITYEYVRGGIGAKVSEGRWCVATEHALANRIINSR